MKEPISIPEARALLRVYAREWDRPELLELSERMVRRTPKYPTARAKRSGLTKALAEKIRRHKDNNPSQSNREIGEIFGVDGGRVSEAIHDINGFFKEGTL